MERVIKCHLDKNPPPGMNKPLERKDHDKVQQGGGENKDRHHPGEGGQQVDCCNLFGEHVALLHLLGVPQPHIGCWEGKWCV